VREKSKLGRWATTPMRRLTATCVCQTSCSPIKRLAAGGADASGEDTDGSGLAGAVRAKETENFAGQNVERDAVESDDFRLGLLALAFGLWRAKGETARAGAYGWSGGKDLAKVHGANAPLPCWRGPLEEIQRTTGAKSVASRQPMVLSTHGMIPEYRHASQFLIVDQSPVTAADSNGRRNTSSKSSIRSPRSRSISR